MLKVAVTGNVASGKTALARIWAREGVPVVLADDLAREVVAPDTPGLAEVAAAFGPRILEGSGALDRPALRKVVFQDPDARARLEEILHPRILERREEWLRERVRENASLAVAEIPLLFETGLEVEFDAVVLVHAPEEERLRRLLQDRGLVEAQARRIMEAQMPAGAKLDRADFVLHNAGSLEELETRALALLDLLRARAAGRDRS